MPDGSPPLSSATPPQAPAEAALGRARGAAALPPVLTTARGWTLAAGLAAALFGAGLASGLALGPRARPPAAAIEITDDLVDGLRADFRRRTGRAPEGAEVEALVRRHVEQEILYREALARGLDRGDVIVRRRLIQVVELAAEEDAARAPTDDGELEAELRRDPQRYQRPARLAFTHVYFGRGPDAEARAAAASERLRAGADPGREGDPFVLGSALGPSSEREIAARFGAAFAAALMALPASDDGRLVGPIESSFGRHLVRVTAREPSRPATLAEARPELTRDLLEHRRAHAREQLVDSLRARYPVHASWTPR